MTSGTFAILDYVIFGLTLGVSAIIGVYFGCFGTKQKSAKEYLYGVGNMKAIPVGLSLYSGSVSTVTIVGTPLEIYMFGTQFLTNGIGNVLSLLITWYLVLPVFCGNLQIKTPYEYFEYRFDTKVRTMMSVIYFIHTSLAMPVILYSCTLGFSEMTGVDLVTCTSVIGGVCVFYTTLGGFSSVIWTDALQATVMVGSCLFVMVKAVSAVGGFSEMWYWADQGKRIEFFNVNPNPFTRFTLWSSTIGMMVAVASYSGCAASAIQRYMSLKNEKQARISTMVSSLGFCVSISICGTIGLAMYAYYHDCDPIKSKKIHEVAQLLPYFLEDIVGHIAGFKGLFMAGLLSAGLSTLSAELNTVSGLIYHDFIRKLFNVNQNRGALIMKIVGLVNGIFYIAVAPLVSKSKSVFQLAISLGGITYGVSLGITLLGTTFPKSNSLGAVCGIISGIIIVGWISIGALFYDVNGPYELPTSIANCPELQNLTDVFNVTTVAPEILNSTIFTSITANEPLQDEPFIIYKLSFMYYAVVGLIVTIVVAMFVSYVTGFNDVNLMDQRLIIPSLRTSEQKSPEEHPSELNLRLNN